MKIWLEKNIKQLWPYLFLIAITAVLLYPVIFDKTASFCIKQDNVHQGYPFFAKLNSSLHKGYLPVWDANTYGGRSLAGGIEPGIFYPLSILWCFLFGSINGIDVYYLDLLVCSHYLICLIGMYRVAKAFRLPTTASIFSACNRQPQLAYSDLYQKLSVNYRVADTLIFSENDYPGWKCDDNGKEIKIYEATIGNHPPLFRSIYLDPATMNLYLNTIRYFTGFKSRLLVHNNSILPRTYFDYC
jgi:hypothetical protein